MNISTNPKLSTKLTIVTDGNEEWTFFELVLVFLLGSISIATITGNSLILYLFCKSKRSLRSSTHWLIANLAIADFCVGAAVMPTLISVTMSDLKWYFGNFACTSSEYFHFCLCAVSLLSMMVISIERYIGVKFPLRHKLVFSRKRIFGVIILIWCLALLLTAGPLTVWPVLEEMLPFSCPVNLRSEFVMFVSVSIYWLPVFVTGLMYWLIYRRATDIELVHTEPDRNMTAINYTSTTTNISIPYNSNANLSTTTTTTSPTLNSDKSDAERFQETKKKQTKLAKELSCIAGIMLILYAPLFIVLILVGLYPSLISLKTLLIVAWIRYFCSCANPYLYFLVIPGFKNALLKVVWNEKRKNGEVPTNVTNADGNGEKVKVNAQPTLQSTISINQESLIPDILSFLNDIKEHSHSMEKQNPISIRNRASQLLQNLVLFSPTVQMQLGEKPFEKLEVKNIDNSSIKDEEEGGKIVTNCFELDPETVQELEDIIAQLESLQKSNL